MPASDHTFRRADSRSRSARKNVTARIRIRNDRTRSAHVPLSAATLRRTILIAEADGPFFDHVSSCLLQYGFQVERAHSIEETSQRATEGDIDAMVVGRNLLGSDIGASSTQLRRAYAGPILLAFEKYTAADAIVALEAGADDAVDKAVGAREILARLRTNIARRKNPHRVTPRGHDRSHTNLDETSPAKQGRWQTWTRTREITTPDGHVLDLTSTEFDVLSYLARHNGELVTRAQLHAAYPRRIPVTKRSRSIDCIISHLRHVLAPHLAGRSAIQSVRGRGYVFTGFDLPDANASIVNEGSGRRRTALPRSAAARH